jgi:uncharacterized spore protein YtfJ
MTAEKSQDHVDQLFSQLDALQKNAKVDAVFGQPMKVDDKTFIPIASVSYSFGGGFGEGQRRAQDPEPVGGGSGAGGGAGVNVRPLAVAEVTPDGLRIEPIVDEQKVVLAGMLTVAWSIFWVARATIKILRR